MGLAGRKGTDVHTIKELRDYAKDRGVSVSRRKVEEWHRAGLLPPASRPPVKGQRGRGPLMFPDPAPDAVVTLGRWRRYMTSDETAKVWLWFEGYDYIPVDIGKVEQSLSTVFLTGWTALQQAIPGLPDTPSTKPTERQEEAILDALDQSVMQPMLRNHESIDASVAAAMMGAAVLGLDVQDGWNDMHKDEDGQYVKGDPDSFADSTVARAIFASQHTPLPDTPLLHHLPGGVSDVLAAASLINFPANVDWDRIRLGQYAFCLYTDEPCPYPDAAPLIEWKRLERKSRYGKGEVGLYLTILAAIAACSLMPADEDIRSARKTLAFYGKDRHIKTRSPRRKMDAAQVAYTKVRQHA